MIFYSTQVSWMSQTVSNGNANSNREVSFMGGPKVLDNNEDVGDTDDIPTIHEG
jgi:hypothetical protein